MWALGSGGDGRGLPAQHQTTPTTTTAAAAAAAAAAATTATTTLRTHSQTRKTVRGTSTRLSTTLVVITQVHHHTIVPSNHTTIPPDHHTIIPPYHRTTITPSHHPTITVVYEVQLERISDPTAKKRVEAPVEKEVIEEKLVFTPTTDADAAAVAPAVAPPAADVSAAAPAVPVAPPAAVAAGGDDISQLIEEKQGGSDDATFHTLSPLGSDATFHTLSPLGSLPSALCPFQPSTPTKPIRPNQTHLPLSD